MTERIIQFSIRNKFIVALFIIALIAWGTYSLIRLPIDAVPDITNNQVQIISVAPSLATQEVESFITAPIEVAVANIPEIIELRSISRLGLSVTTVVFEDKTDIYWARQQLSERLKEAEENIPEGLAKIELAPISTGLGEIYQYHLVVDKEHQEKYNPMDLRTLQDWVVRREMLGTQGVAEINSYGGFVKQYEISVNPERLRSIDLTLNDIFVALERNNENTGSAYIDKNPTAYFIRGIGLVKSLEDIEKIVVKSNPSGIPVLIRDIATVQYGSATRYGALVVDTAEAVGGVVMMLKGANAHEVIDNVETRIASIQKSLPDGVTIEPFLNRSDLVGRAINTVSRNLIEGALIVIFILVLLLGDFRAGLIVASVIPLSMLFALSMMNLFGVSGNLMSLGAIDFGLIVDGAVIIVESVVHRISKNQNLGVARLSQKQMDESVFESAKRMMSSATFGQVIILMVYLPIIALVGIEGKMFRPMAQVVMFALIGAAILSLTYVPMVSALFLSKKTERKRNISDKIMDAIQKVFDPIINFALKRKLIVSVSALLLFFFSLFVFSNLGGEFIPQLEEGDLAAGVMTLQGSSLTNSVETVIKANKILLDNFPEIKHAVCKVGTSEIPTDPTPMETGDYIITLKDKSEWTSAKTREELVAKMEEKLVVLAGVKFEFQQPIQMRTNELMSGSKQDIAVKIFGDDLNTLSDKGAEVESIINKIEGVEDINVEKVTGLAQVQVEYNRDRLAQYGLSIDDVNKVLRTAFAGSEAGTVFDEEKRFALVVRLDKDYRQSLEDVKNLFVALPDGGQIPFDQIADIQIKSGPAQVSRENTKRRITIGFNVRNRDVQSVINQVSKEIETNISMPTGYFISYGGQFQNLEAARKRLLIAVPVALLMIFVLLFFTFNSFKQSLLIFTTVPMSAIGGIFALWLRDMNFSISAGVGFIALFGVAVLNGIVLIAEFNRLEKAGKTKDAGKTKNTGMINETDKINDTGMTAATSITTLTNKSAATNMTAVTNVTNMTEITDRVRKGLQTRLRPVIITAAVASLGFLPMALSTSSGAEVQKPLATVVIGGLISATFLTMVILPVFYIFFTTHSFKPKRRNKKLSALTILLAILGLTSANAQVSEKSVINTVVNSQVVESESINNTQVNFQVTETKLITNPSKPSPQIINLRQAIQIALDSNLSVRSTEYSLEVQKALKGSSLDLPKTMIEAQYGQFNSLTKDNSLTISQSFAFPTVYSNQHKLANANIKSSKFQLKASQLETATKVKQIYWQLAYLHSMNKLLEYQDSLFAGFLRAATLRANIGETNRLEMITARSQSLEAQNQLKQSSSNLIIYNQKLKTLLNTQQSFCLFDTILKKYNSVIINILTSDKTIIQNSSLSNQFGSKTNNTLSENPTAAYVLQQVEISHREKKLEDSKMLPDLSIGFFTQTMIGAQESDRILGSGDRLRGIQAGVAIPLWLKPFTSRSKAAKMKQKEALTNAEYYLQSLEGEYLALVGEYSKFSSSVDYYEKQAIPEANIIIDQATRSYRAGAIDYLDYIQNLKQALTIKQNYLEVLNNYNQTVISLEALTGKIF